MICRRLKTAVLALTLAPLLAVAALVGSAPPTQAQTITNLTLPPIPGPRVLKKLTTYGEFRLAAGDADFFGHGPIVTVDVKLRVSADGRKLYADLTGTASEVGGTTRAVLNAIGVTIYTIEDNNQILSINSPTTGTLYYRDYDHHIDYVCETVGEIHVSNSWLTRFSGTKLKPCSAGLVHTAAVMGDMDGADVNTYWASFTKVNRTSLQVMFSDIKVTVANSLAAPPIALRPFALAVPFADSTQENFPEDGDNGCGASSGWRVLDFYGVDTDYPSFLARMRDRFHFSNVFTLGVPPSTLVTALNELSPGFGVARLTTAHDTHDLQANLAKRLEAKTKLVQILRSNRPVIALLAWGSRTAYSAGDAVNGPRYHGLYSPIFDEANFNYMHYVVVRGYSPLTDTFEIVDNGMGTTWRADFLLNMMMFDVGLDMQMVFSQFAPGDVQPTTIIYKK